MTQAGSEPQISPEIVAEAIAEQRGQLFSDVRSEVYSALIAMSPSESLTLRLLSGDSEVRRISPSPTADYARALIAFTRGQSFNGYEVDSAVTPVTLAAITHAVQRFYGSEDISGVIAASISSQIEASGVLRRELDTASRQNAAWLRKEATTALHENTAYSIAGQAIDATTDAIGQILHTTAGQNIIATLGKVLATTGGKAILLGGLKAAVVKIMATSAAQTMIIGLVKKVGIGVLIKTAIGKVIIVALAAVGLSAPLWVILLPIIIGFLAYEYNHFPAKLADKIPTEVDAVFSSHFHALNKSVSETIVAEVLKRAADAITEVHTGRTL